MQLVIISDETLMSSNEQNATLIEVSDTMMFGQFNKLPTRLVQWSTNVISPGGPFCTIFIYLTIYLGQQNSVLRRSREFDLVPVTHELNVSMRQHQF